MRIRLLVLTFLLIFSACAPAADTLSMAPLSDMPAEVQSASVTVQDAYRFAVANPDLTKALPCYCGCGSMGHTSNYACYVQSENDGSVTFDAHALGCSICVDITIDAMRMTREGLPLDEIRAEIDNRYRQFGPSNMP
jgi:hypothetical protein